MVPLFVLFRRFPICFHSLQLIIYYVSYLDKHRFFPPLVLVPLALRLVRFSLSARIQPLASCGTRRTVVLVPFIIPPRSIAIGVRVEDRTKPRSQQSRIYTQSLAPSGLFLFLGTASAA